MHGCEVCGSTATRKGREFRGVRQLMDHLRNAANCLETRKRDDSAYAYSLECLADHLADVRDGKHTWQEFAEAYCLTPKESS